MFECIDSSPYSPIPIPTLAGLMLVLPLEQLVASTSVAASGTTTSIASTLSFSSWASVALHRPAYFAPDWSDGLPDS